MRLKKKRIIILLSIYMIIAGLGWGTPIQAEEPGLYSGPGYGWTYSGDDVDDRGRLIKGYYYYSRELHGFVGLPFEEKPTAKCVGGGWRFTSPVQIETGALPPGLYIDEAGRITGVPERAGTWYLRVRWDGVECAGKTYSGSYQNLKIITSGSSAPRSLP